MNMHYHLGLLRDAARDARNPGIPMYRFRDNRVRDQRPNVYIRRERLNHRNHSDFTFLVFVDRPIGPLPNAAVHRVNDGPKDLGHDGLQERP